MRRAICVFAFGLILLAGSTAASAQSSNPVIQGGVQGKEVCPEFICGVALFIGGFEGRVGANPAAVGIITAAMTHGELPTSIGASTPIFDGAWELRTLIRRISGKVLGGSITYAGGNLFEIRILLDLRSGGGGFVFFAGILDHNTPIPGFRGNLLQLP